MDFNYARRLINDILESEKVQEKCNRDKRQKKRESNILSYRIAKYYHELFLMWYNNRNRTEGPTLLGLIKDQLKWNPETTAGTIDEPSDKVIQQRIQSSVIVSLLEQYVQENYRSRIFDSPFSGYLFFVPIVQQGRRSFLMTHSHHHTARELEKDNNFLKQLLWSYECVIQLALLYNTDVKQRYFKRTKKHLPNGNEIPDVRREEYWKNEVRKIEGFLLPSINTSESPGGISVFSDTQVNDEQAIHSVSLPILESQNRIDNKSEFVVEVDVPIARVGEKSNQIGITDGDMEDSIPSPSSNEHEPSKESITKNNKKRVQAEKQQQKKLKTPRIVKDTNVGVSSVNKIPMSLSKEEPSKQTNLNSHPAPTKKNHPNETTGEREASKGKSKRAIVRKESAKKSYLLTLEKNEVETTKSTLKIKGYMYEAFSMYESFVKSSIPNEFEKKQKKEEIIESYSKAIYQFVKE